MTKQGVYEKIAAVQAELAKTGIAKNRRNQQQNYAFRGIDDVYSALAPLLAQHRLSILPRVVSRELVERTTKNGTALFYVTVEAEFDFVSADDGSCHVVRTFGEAMDSGDKATNKAMSAAYKYAAFMAFAIPTEGDNDADQTTHDVAPRGAAQGHSQTGAVSSDGPKPREKLSGPYTSRSTLQTEVKSFVHTMNGIADWDEWCAYRDTKEVVALLEQVRRDIPEWWEGGPSMPDEFVPLHRQIEVHEANLAQQIADIARV